VTGIYPGTLKKFLTGFLEDQGRILTGSKSIYEDPEGLSK